MVVTALMLGPDSEESVDAGGGCGSKEGPMRDGALGYRLSNLSFIWKKSHQDGLTHKKVCARRYSLYQGPIRDANLSQRCHWNDIT